MGLLSDKDIGPLIAAGLLVKGFSSVPLTRGAAVELSVGDIFVPGTSSTNPGSVGIPLNALSLLQGQTAVIRTLEYITLNQNYAGIAFPAAYVSLQGLLMTNPGYIDPGYAGNLHVTVINMGREPYLIKREDRLMRCLFFSLDSTASTAYPQRPSPISDLLLRRLSRDFMNIEERASTVAKRAIDAVDLRIKLWQVGVPVIVAVLTVLGSMFLNFHTIEGRLTKLEVAVPNSQQLDSRLVKMEALLPLEQRVNTLETKTVSEIDARIKHIEDSQKH